jgi:two-component system cell cycle sensor histidine kinase/response regulator CckA
MKFPRFGSAPPAPAPANPLVVGPIPDGATVVLMVDDEPAVRNLFALALSREGYHVLQAGNGAEALELAAQLDAIDLVVSDIVMPVMKGPELAVRLRERFPDLHFVFVSGYLVSDDLGPNSQMLAKPFLRQDLVKRVQDAIGPPRPH